MYSPCSFAFFEGCDEYFLYKTQMSAKKSRPRLIKLDLTQMDMNALAGVSDSTKAMESPSNHLGPALQDLPNQFKKDVQLQDLELLQELGSGNGGTVYQVMHKSTRSIMALKVHSSFYSCLLKPQGDTCRGQQQGQETNFKRVANIARL